MKRLSCRAALLFGAIIATSLSFAVSARAKNAPFEAVVEVPTKTLEGLQVQYDRFAASRNRSRTPAPITLKLPLKGKVYTVLLKPSDVVAEKYKAARTRGKKNARSSTKPPVQLFSGEIQEIDGFLRLALFPKQRGRRDQLSGLLSIGTQLYRVSLKSLKRGPTQTLLVREMTLAETDTFLGLCGDLAPDSADTVRKQLQQRIVTAPSSLSALIQQQTRPVRVIELATEADCSFVQSAGSGPNANAAIAAIVNDIDGIYRSYLRLSLKIVFQHTWDSCSGEPYDTPTLQDRLFRFGSHWNSNYRNRVAFDVAHLWSGRGDSGSTAGIAWTGAMCRNIGPECNLTNVGRVACGPYGVATRVNMSDPQKTTLSAHELGHNLGANHDTTSGLVMDPYVNSSRQFSDASVSAIENHLRTYDPNATCLAAESSNRALAIVDAASFRGVVAPNSFVAAFGTGLDQTSAISIEGTGANSRAYRCVRGGAGDCVLGHVGTSQLNFTLPKDLVPGSTYVVKALAGTTLAAQGLITVASAAPAVFSASANGKGVTAGYAIQRGRSTGDLNEALFRAGANGLVANPIRFQRDELFLAIYSTGGTATCRRGRPVKATIGGVSIPVLSYSEAPSFPGVDHLNLNLTSVFSSLPKGRELQFELTLEDCDGVQRTSNATTLLFQ